MDQIIEPVKQQPRPEPRLFPDQFTGHRNSTPDDRAAIALQEALVAVDRLYQILDLEAEQCGPMRKLPFTGIRQAIELREVSFRYGYRANVLEQVTLRLPAGQTVAIVGESGSGKSTVLKLLLGFYTPTEGRILIDGVDMQDFELASLRSRMGLVSQDPFIFTGTVRENIALGRPDAALAEILEAARAAELDPFITSLPERYETVIGERGANLSGGQRLAIARALLRQPELLIFDEATSHLDTTTERAIQHSLTMALTGKTVVLVAHRLSTIKEADLIYVLHQGRIVQAGTHRELLAQEGRYRLLWRAQTDETEGSLRVGGGRGLRHRKKWAPACIRGRSELCGLTWCGISLTAPSFAKRCSPVPQPLCMAPCSCWLSSWPPCWGGQC